MAGIAKQSNLNRSVVNNHWAARRGKDPGLVHGFRSGLESANAEWLTKLGVEVSFETTKVRYVIPTTFHIYTPDFTLPNGIIIETKGKFEPSDRKKHLLVRAQWPDLDIRLVFQRPSDRLTKASKTTYAMWAEKNGIKWAFKLIPKQWTEEAGPSRKPEDVLAGKPVPYQEVGE